MTINAPIQKYRLDVNQWQKMGEAGVFPPDSPHLELINGEILQMPPIGFNHAGHVKRLAHVFARLLVSSPAILSVQDPLKLGELSEPEPDFMLLRPEENFYTTRHPQADDVLLLIEVADSSLRYDREQKARLYALYGIVEYWLINLTNNSIEVYRQPQGDNYAQKLTLYYNEIIGLVQLPDIRINTSAILSK